MYSPIEIKHTNVVRMGVNKKKHIIKGKRYLKNITSTHNSDSHFNSK